MQTLKAIATTSGFTVDKKIFMPVSTLIAGIEKEYINAKSTQAIGMPFLLGHDYTKLIGWNQASHILINDKAYLYTKISIIETEEDRNYLHKLMVLKQIERIKNNSNIERIIEIVKSNNINLSRKYLRESCMLPSFYQKDVLLKIIPNLPIDENGMIDYSYLIDNFEANTSGCFRHKTSNIVIFADKHFKRSSNYMNNGNLYFFQSIAKFYEKNKNNCKIKLKIDMDIFSYSEKLSCPIELEYWWGVPFSKDVSLLKTGVTIHGMTENDGGRNFENITKTEFHWYEGDVLNGSKLKTLEIEEIKDKSVFLDENEKGYVFKYLHAQIEPKLKKVVHFDGSVRVYDEDKYNQRISMDISKTEKDAEYAKLFRVDGLVDIEDWKELINTYFIGNHLIMEYFEGKHKEESPAPNTEQKIHSNDNINKDVNLSIYYSFTDDSYDNNYEVISSQEDLETFYNAFDKKDLKDIDNLVIKFFIKNSKIPYVLIFYGTKDKVVDLLNITKQYIKFYDLPSTYIESIHGELRKLLNLNPDPHYD